MSLVWSPSRCCLENRRYPCPSPSFGCLKRYFIINADNPSVRELLIMRIALTGSPYTLLRHINSCLTLNQCIMTNDFTLFLRQENMSDNTISAYTFAVKDYFAHQKELNKRNLLAHKNYLMENFKPKTVNLRIQALNKYLEFTKHPRLKLKSVKVQQRSYLENVISNADYTFLKNKLRKEPNLEWYFVVRYLAATGARVSELVQIKIEHVNVGYFDIYAKGGKYRRIFIPKKLREESEAWIQETGRSSGYLFLNRFGERITTRGISQQLKNYAQKYKMNPLVVYPHSFRHRFAVNGNFVSAEIGKINFSSFRKS